MLHPCAPDSQADSATRSRASTSPRITCSREPAGRDISFRPRLVLLRRGATAHALLTITEAGDFPARQCRVRTAVALRVIPPGGAHPAFVPRSFAACSRKGPLYLHIRVVRPGVGIPGVSQ